ncbi:MAG: hypothetical protein AAFX05_06800 [Planctomycetota bacterium]
MTTESSTGIGSSGVSRGLGAVLSGVSRLTRWVALLLCGLSGLSACVMFVLAAMHPDWWVAMFELTVVVTGGIGVLTVLGFFKQGPGLALVCCGAVISACAVLAEPAMPSQIFGAGAAPLVISGVEILPLMAARAVAGVLIMAAGVLDVWSRRPAQSAGYLLRAIPTGIPALMLISIPVWGQVRGVFRPVPGVQKAIDGLIASLWGMPKFLVAVVAIVGFFVVLGLFSAAVHCLIRSLEVGRLPERERSGGDEAATDERARPAAPVEKEAAAPSPQQATAGV